jgi:DNA-binding response OmpR family regulator
MLDSKKIMIVDDDVTLLEMYIERLKAEGAIISQAYDGEEALEKMKKSKPELILLDVMMPKMNGFDVLKAMQADADLSKIPVIILTALNDDSKRAQGFKLGAVDYIVKADTLPGDVVKKVKAGLDKPTK